MTFGAALTGGVLMYFQWTHAIISRSSTVTPPANAVAVEVRDL